MFFKKKKKELTVDDIIKKNSKSLERARQLNAEMIKLTGGFLLNTERQLSMK